MLLMRQQYCLRATSSSFYCFIALRQDARTAQGLNAASPELCNTSRPANGMPSGIMRQPCA